MSSNEDRKYVQDVLWPEFNGLWDIWQEEYSSQKRDLGSRGEFCGFWRKAKKIKAIVWDGIDARDWREGVRIIIMEVIAHAFLMLADLDRERDDELERVNWTTPPPNELGDFAQGQD